MSLRPTEHVGMTYREWETYMRKSVQLMSLKEIDEAIRSAKHPKEKARWMAILVMKREGCTWSAAVHTVHAVAKVERDHVIAAVTARP